VAVSVGVAVRVGVGVEVDVGVTVAVGVAVAVAVAVVVGVAVAVGVGVSVGVAVSVGVGVGVTVGVTVAVVVVVGVTVTVGVAVGVGVAVAVSVGVGVGVASLVNTNDSVNVTKESKPKVLLYRAVTVRPAVIVPPSSAINTLTTMRSPMPNNVDDGLALHIVSLATDVSFVAESEPRMIAPSAPPVYRTTLARKPAFERLDVVNPSMSKVIGPAIVTAAASAGDTHAIAEPPAVCVTCMVAGPIAVFVVAFVVAMPWALWRSW